jgi:hypothetical protein
MSSRQLNSGPLLDGGSAARVAWWQPLQLDEVARTVRSAWSAWMRDWIGLPIAPCVGVTCTLAQETAALADLGWEPVGTRGCAAAWMAVGHGAVEKIQAAMFGADPHVPSPFVDRDGIAHAVAADARAALPGNLRHSLGLDCDPAQSGPRPGIFKPWSGGVVAAPRDGIPLEWSLLLNAECVRALVQVRETPLVGRIQDHRTGLIPLEQAMAEHKLLIQAQLTGCELDFGHLEDLRIGDVVPLTHALDAPLFVSTAAEDHFCSAFLGGQAGLKAIELVRNRPFIDCGTPTTLHENSHDL